MIVQRLPAAIGEFLAQARAMARPVMAGACIQSLHILFGQIRVPRCRGIRL